MPIVLKAIPRNTDPTGVVMEQSMFLGVREFVRCKITTLKPDGHVVLKFDFRDDPKYAFNTMFIACHPSRLVENKKMLKQTFNGLERLTEFVIIIELMEIHISGPDITGDIIADEIMNHCGEFITIE